MEEILKYIKLYTGCNDHALKRIEALLEQKMQTKIVCRKVNTKTSIAKWSESYFLENATTYNAINQRSKKKEVVSIRTNYIKQAYLDGFTCTSIAKFLQRDHSTILHAIHK